MTAARRGDQMIRQKSSLFQGLRMQSELVQPSELWREPEDLSSVEESATLVGTGVRTELGTTALVGADEDPAVNLFPVRMGQSGRLMNVY